MAEKVLVLGGRLGRLTTARVSVFHRVNNIVSLTIFISVGMNRKQREVE